MPKQKRRISLDASFLQKLLKNPLHYIWGLGTIAAIFIVLGLVIRFFWAIEQKSLPVIEGPLGPLRIRPALTKNQPPSRRIYGDLTLKTSQKSTESLLPPEEMPDLKKEVPLPSGDEKLPPTSVVQVSSSSPPKPIKTERPSLKKVQKVPPASAVEVSSSSPPKPIKTERSSLKKVQKVPSLDDLLDQVDELSSLKQSKKSETSE
ncbi:MAG: hypothetical protein ACRC12_04145 [Holosporales bacterium]